MNHAGRGDEESISKKQASIERISIRHELAAPPWFVQTEDDELVESLHWGTRFDGLERAWNKEKQVTDVKKQNVMVRLAIFTALKGCSLLYKPDGRRGQVPHQLGQQHERGAADYLYCSTPIQKATSNS